MRPQPEGAYVGTRALDRRQPAERAIQMRRDELLELIDPVAHAGHQGLDEAAVGLVELLDAARRPQRIAAGELPGVQRLQRDLACLPFSGFYAAAFSASPFRRRRAPLRRPCRAAPRPALRPRS